MDLLKGERPVKHAPKLALHRVLYIGIVLPIVLAYLAIATIIREIFIGGNSVLDLIGRFRLRANSGLVQRAASKTAIMVALVRFVGSKEGWTNDTLSRHFLPSEVVHAIEVTKLFEPNYPLTLKRVGLLMARTLAGDRIILNGKPKQVVLLGAGLDTRAHRLKLPYKDCRFYEVDIATTQAMKKTISLEHADEFTNKEVRYISVDFSSELFTDKLVSESDFDPTCPDTVVLFEGVSMYLPWPALEQTLRLVSTKFAPGTILGMDCLEDFFTNEEARRRQDKNRLLKRLTRLVEAVGEPFQWGVPLGKTVQDVFPQLGFELLADVTSKDVESMFLPPPAEDDAKKRPFSKLPSIWHYLILKVA